MPSIEFGRKMKRFAEEAKKETETAVATEIATEVEESPEAQQEAVAEEQVVVPETVVVNKNDFYRLAYALVIGTPQVYLGIAGMKRIGEMLGAKTYEECQNKWQEIKDYVNRK